jgi:hypothetical protein
VHDRTLGRHAHQRRAHVPTGSCGIATCFGFDFCLHRHRCAESSDFIAHPQPDTLAAADLSALLHRLRQRSLHRIEGGTVDQWPDQHAIGQRIADGHRGIDIFQARHQRRMHAAMDKQPP